jgi:hypothetical protein
VTSTPKGAAIFLDGREEAAVTPAQIHFDAAKPPKAVRLVKRGYTPLDIPLDRRALTEGIAVMLARVPVIEPTTFSFSGDYPFELLEGSRTLQDFDRTHELKITERRTIRMHAPAVFLDKAVTLEPGGSRRAVSAPRTGSLRIISTTFERCLVSIGGERAEGLPINVQAIAEGTHEITLKCPGGDSLKRSITVHPGQLNSETIR